MLKQPVGFKILTNVAIVRLKLGKSRFEIACYRNKVQDWRDKKETDINEVLQSSTIFKNAIKGDIASKSELKHVFPNMEDKDIVKLILEKGVIQITDKERETTSSNVKNEISNIIYQKTYNTETGLPFPVDVITQTISELKINIADNQDPKKQALKIIKEIMDKQALPLERKLMKLNLSLKDIGNFKDESEFKNFSEKFENFLTEIQCEILESKMDEKEAFHVKCRIKPNYYRELLTKYDKFLTIEIISNEEIGKLNEKNEEQNKINNLEDLKELKLANSNIDKFIEENYKDEIDIKKLIKCTKCKDSTFNSQNELRQHYKSNWHRFNALRSARGEKSLNAIEFDEYSLMHPEVLK